MLMADLDLPQRVLREQIGSALNFIVHLNRFADGARRVTHITEIEGVDDGTVLMQDLFVTRRERDALVMRGTGIVPASQKIFHERGFEIDHQLFQQ